MINALISDRVLQMKLKIEIELDTIRDREEIETLIALIQQLNDKEDEHEYED